MNAVTVYYKITATSQYVLNLGCECSMTDLLQNS